MRPAIRHVPVHWDRHITAVWPVSLALIMSVTFRPWFIHQTHQQVTQAVEAAININRPYCLPVKGEGRNNPTRACYQCIAVCKLGRIYIYRKAKLINFLSYNATKSFFIQTTFYLYYLYKLFKEDIHKLVFKQKTPTWLYLFIQKDFSFEIMLKILHFGPYLLFHNSIERDAQLGQLRFQRGELRSLLRKEKNPNISGSNWRLESFPLKFKSIRNIGKF